MSTEDIFRKLKKEVENATAEAQRAKGAYDQLTHQLEEEFGCKSLKEAENLLSKLETRTEKSREEFERALEEYEQEWKDETTN